MITYHAYLFKTETKPNKVIFSNLKIFMKRSEGPTKRNVSIFLVSRMKVVTEARRAEVVNGFNSVFCNLAKIERLEKSRNSFRFEIRIL